MEKYTCTCCKIPKSYSRSDKLYNHRKKYDIDFVLYLDQLEEKRRTYNISPRLCACGKPLPFERRDEKYCSRSCAVATNNSLIPKRKKNLALVVKYCLVCSKPLNRERSKYCGRKCCIHHLGMKRSIKNSLDKINRINDWETGKLDASLSNGELCDWAKEYLKEQAGACQKCGWADIHPTTGRVPLQVDHIDGCFSNNKIDNLRVLCPNCHSLTETYGSLNKGGGRTYRLKTASKSYTRL